MIAGKALRTYFRTVAPQLGAEVARQLSIRGREYQAALGEGFDAVGESRFRLLDGWRKAGAFEAHDFGEVGRGGWAEGEICILSRGSHVRGNDGLENKKPACAGSLVWRRGPESNRRKRLCRPLHNHFATPPRGEEFTLRFSVNPAILGAGEESRTLDLNLGKVALYQLSYSRIWSLSCNLWSGAGEESRTLDLNLGKVALYQLSYSRTAKNDDYIMLDWSGRRVSNSRPQPWQGCALPTELLPRRHNRQAL